MQTWNNILTWLGQNPKIVALIVAGVVLLLVVALVLGRDLEWVPDVLRRLVGG